MRLLPITVAIALLAVAGCGGTTSGSAASAPPHSASATNLIGAPSQTPTVPVSDGLAELPAAKAIPGVSYHPAQSAEHVKGSLAYDSTPPVGGNHSQYWADCTGTVYPKAIANENAVHMLEHGAVWITYNATTLPADQLAILTKAVDGVDRLALSPYPDLKTPISLQSWGYQLFVESANDPRIVEFISALTHNPETTPEYGATCSQPAFKLSPSTFGHPLWLPAS